jgi:O-methyltransferase involved in polyketide biosynthesis
VDREVAAKVLEHAPELVTMAREGRDFLVRVVRFLAEAGIRQFVDIGSGLPTRRNVHEVAREVAPDARVVYVDNDPVVLAHARALLGGSGAATVIAGDLNDPGGILEHPELRNAIDLDRPVAFLLISVLHLIPDDERAARVAARLREAMCPGSYLAIAHAVSDLRPEQTMKIASLYRDSGAVENGPRRQLRTKAEVEPFFGDLELVDPGFVYVHQWRPEHSIAGDTRPIWSAGGVGRKV